MEQYIEPQEETGATIAHEIEEELNAGATAIEELTEEEDDLDVNNYIEITPTLFIQAIEPNFEEGQEVDEEELEKYKILNPETGLVETRKLTDEEKHEIYVLELKRAQIKFRPLKNPVKSTIMYSKKTVLGKEREVKEKSVETVTNKTINPYGSQYKQKRKRKNSLTKKSRKANR